MQLIRKRYPIGRPLYASNSDMMPGVEWRWVGVQALVHTALGGWLDDVDGAARDTAAGAAGRPAPERSARALPRPMVWTGRMAVAFGSLVVVLLVRFINSIYL